MHLGKKVINLRFSIQHDPLVCYSAVFSVVTQRSSPLGGALRDDTKNGFAADYMIPLLIPTSSPGSSRFPIWRRQERRPWHTAN